VRIRFLGAAGTVTGSRFLVSGASTQFLVDCGMFQGSRAIRRRNWDTFPVPATDIGAVVLTHAHLDHCGYLPALVKQGFRGPIYCTPNTAALVPIILRDSAHLQEEDTAYARRSGYSRHADPQPLYTTQDAETAINVLLPRDFGQAFAVTEEFACRFDPAGHILGSSTVTVTEIAPSPQHARAVFSGDLGRGNHPLLKGPHPPLDADAVVMEGTYGDRDHADVDAEMEEMADAITRTINQGGTVVVPAFAVDRTEVLLTALRDLMDQHRIPVVPIYADSPMALAGLSVYRDAIKDADPEITTATIAEGISQIHLPGLHEAHSTEESKKLDTPGPKIIISASGMASGGRVTHHLKYFLPHPNNCVLLVGYQAMGTPGQQLRDGARSVRIHGQDIPVHAQVVDIEAFSVHADRSELVTWIASARTQPVAVYLVHAEHDSASALKALIEGALGIPVTVAEDEMTVEVTAQVSH